MNGFNYRVTFDADGIPSQSEMLFEGVDLGSVGCAEGQFFVFSEALNPLVLLRDGKVVFVSEDEHLAALERVALRNEALSNLCEDADKRARLLGYTDFSEAERTLNPVAQGSTPDWFAESTALVKWKYAEELKIRGEAVNEKQGGGMFSWLIGK
jgi:hypothetical protein